MELAGWKSREDQGCGVDVLPWRPLRGTADSERRHQQGSAVDLRPIPLSKLLINDINANQPVL